MANADNLVRHRIYFEITTTCHLGAGIMPIPGEILIAFKNNIRAFPAFKF